MTITSVQMKAMMDVINSLLTTTGQRKRQVSAMFLELVDRTDWPQYYEVIPEPRCLNNIKAGLEKNRYKDALDVYTDLSLVFWNALFYNETDSQIAVDAQTLKTVLETEWKKHTLLPIPRLSPPPSSAQKVHKLVGVPAPPLTPPPALVAIVSPPPLARTATHIASIHTAPAPVASTSTANHIYTKPVAIRPRSAQYTSTDMDVDIMSDVDGGGDEMSAIIERDPESEEIVKQLEKGLPRWPGFGEEGWTQDISPERIVEIVHVIKSYKDVVGTRVAVALEAVPEESTIPYLSYTSPLSLKIIENHARAKSYDTFKGFGLEMARLFEKARRWHKPSTEPYGRVLLLQRLFQALVSQDRPPGPPYHSTTNFAALRAGPGNVKPVHTGGVGGSGGVGGNASSEDGTGGGVAGVTTHRVLTKDRTFVDEVYYMGWTLKLADWVHLSNPDDPSRPIVAQVFRCWVSEEPSKKGQQGITVSWYFRPEQTFHPANRTFWEGEVFKTSHFAEHSLEDIIEKIACQFTARHIRGRPRPPFWYLGFPLYMCDSRYNDRDRVFVRIKNWNSCVPEEVRKREEFMPIYPFEKTVMPGRFPSPFVGKGAGAGGKKWPGGILAEAAGGDRGVKEEEKVGGLGEGGRKRTRRAVTGGDGAANKGGANNAVPSSLAAGYPYQPSQVQAPKPPGPDRSVVTAAGGMAVVGQGAHIEKLSPDVAKQFDRDPETNEVLWFPAPPVDAPRRTAPKYSLAYLHFLAAKRKRDMTPEGRENGNGMDVEMGLWHA